MNRYRVLLPLTVHTEDGAYTQGETFEKDFTEDEEAANLQSGLLEIVPIEYKVVGSSIVHGTLPGGTFTAALRVGEEALLVSGGHIERLVEQSKAKTKRADRS